MRLGLQPLSTAAEMALLGQQGSPIAVDSPTVDQLFGTGVYKGGAMVLHALRLEVGDDAFFQILRQWVARYTGSSATSDDFRSLSAEVAGRDLERLLRCLAQQLPTLPTPTRDEVQSRAGRSANERSTAQQRLQYGAPHPARSVRAGLGAVCHGGRSPAEVDARPAQRFRLPAARAMADPRERDEV